MNCEGCKYLHCIRGQQRGVMDCDPDEFVCSLHRWEFEDEDAECEHYEEYDYYKEQEDYEDYLLDKWECDNDR